MQTFLPYPAFISSATCLDYRRLGKQRVEAYQILNILEGKTDKPGWRNHPAVKMWQGYEGALGIYMNVMIFEWTRRGYKNNMKFSPYVKENMPPWLGDPSFHASHRSNLLRKDEAFYRKLGWKEPVNIPYVWPVTK